MLNKILIATNNESIVKGLAPQIDDSGYESIIASSGKDAQLAIYTDSFFSCLLDANLVNHTCFEVLRYIKCSKPSLPVFLYFDSKDDFAKTELTIKDLRVLGVSDVLIGHTSLRRAISKIEEFCHPASWEKISGKNTASEEREVAELDKKFTRLSIDQLHMGSTTIFDIYIRLKKDKYLKIFQRGDFFDPQRIENYKEKKVEFLYFKTRERSTYINYMNKVILKTLKAPGVSSQKKFDLLKNTTDKIYESIVTEGINPRLVEESMQLCKSLHANIEVDKNLAQLFGELEEFDSESYRRGFAVSFFSVLISKNLSWGSERTSKIVGFASLIHDIGLLKLSPGLSEIRPEKMNPLQLEQYHTHPAVGVEMLNNYPSIKEPTRQILYQHHELVDGTGFPNSLTGIRTYPLAKIVNVADRYSQIMYDNKLAPLDALRKFMQDRDEVRKRDPEAMKALIAGFIGKA